MFGSAEVQVAHIDLLVFISETLQTVTRREQTDRHMVGEKDWMRSQGADNTEEL